ncbi:unnamed protein product [Clavelina lepadiformis]|uniref:LCCL domain-containing protein n=1 Tax=Clavelina lepadiformis TaxID=159417 RepID=A0ABP0FYD6_CLALP
MYYSWILDNQTFAKVLCPPGCLNEKRCSFGNATYSSNSPICKAASHDGRIKNDGGSFVVYVTGGQANLKGNRRNGDKQRVQRLGRRGFQSWTALNV